MGSALQVTASLRTPQRWPRTLRRSDCARLVIQRTTKAVNSSADGTAYQKLPGTRLKYE